MFLSFLGLSTWIWLFSFEIFFIIDEIKHTAIGKIARHLHQENYRKCTQPKLSLSSSFECGKSWICSIQLNGSFKNDKSPDSGHPTAYKLSKRLKIAYILALFAHLSHELLSLLEVLAALPPIFGDELCNLMWYCFE